MSPRTGSLPPGPTAPSIVQMLRFLRDPPGFLDDCHQRYGDTFTVRFPSIPWLPPNMPIVFMSDPAAVRDIFTGPGDQLWASQANVDLAPLLGERSLLLLEGRRHLRERRLMQPPFHGERMLAYGRTMQQVSARAVAAWPVGRSFPVHPEMQRITLSVIMRTVFGLAEGPEFERLGSLLARLLQLGTNPLAAFFPLDLGPFTPWGRFRRLQREVAEILLAEIARRRAGAEEGDDVLSMLIAARDEAGNPMTDAELHDEMITLLVAGHETTATALAWAFHRILANPAVLERLQAEIAAVAGNDGLAPDHVSKLDYLDATVKETLRLHPIIPLVGRVLQSPLRIGGWDLPAGVAAAPCIYLAHRRPEVWSEPARFLPERFLGQPANPYTFFPFGGGMRRCLGMAFALYEMKVVLAEVLSRVSLRATPGITVRVVPRSITLAPSGGMPVVMDARAA